MEGKELEETSAVEEGYIENDYDGGQPDPGEGRTDVSSDISKLGSNGVPTPHLEQSKNDTEDNANMSCTGKLSVLIETSADTTDVVDESEKNKTITPNDDTAGVAINEATIQNDAPVPVVLDSVKPDDALTSLNEETQVVNTDVKLMEDEREEFHQGVECASNSSADEDVTTPPLNTIASVKTQWTTFDDVDATATTAIPHTVETKHIPVDEIETGRGCQNISGKEETDKEGGYSVAMDKEEGRMEEENKNNLCLAGQSSDAQDQFTSAVIVTKTSEIVEMEKEGRGDGGGGGWIKFDEDTTGMKSKTIGSPDQSSPLERKSGDKPSVNVLLTTTIAEDSQHNQESIPTQRDLIGEENIASSSGVSDSNTTVIDSSSRTLDDIDHLAADNKVTSTGITWAKFEGDTTQTSYQPGHVDSPLKTEVSQELFVQSEGLPQGETVSQLSTTEEKTLESAPEKITVSDTVLTSTSPPFTKNNFDWQSSSAPAMTQPIKTLDTSHSETGPAAINSSAMETVQNVFIATPSQNTQVEQFFNQNASRSHEQQTTQTNIQTVPSKQYSISETSSVPRSGTPKHWVSFDEEGSNVVKAATTQPQEGQGGHFFGSSFQQSTGKVAYQDIGVAGNPFTRELLSTQQQYPNDQLSHQATVVATGRLSPYNPFKCETSEVDGAITQAGIAVEAPLSPSFNPFGGSAAVVATQSYSVSSPPPQPPQSPGNPFRVQQVPDITQQQASPFVSNLLDFNSPRSPGPQSAIFEQPPPVPPHDIRQPAVIQPTQPEASAILLKDIAQPEIIFEEIPPEIAEMFADNYPPERCDPLKGWALQLRVPDRKKITGSRYWKPVQLRLIDSNVLQLYNETNPMEPFRELPLQSSYVFSPHKLQPYDTQGKIHTIKIEYVSYKEKKKFGSKHTVEHICNNAQLLKIGTTDYKLFRSFIATVNNTLMRLPAYRDRGTTYRQDAITFDVTDRCRARLRQNGEVERISTTVHIHCLAFVTGMPECLLGLNDYHRQGVEIVSRQDIIPHKGDQWIKMENVEFHNCVDREKFVSDRFIEFNPLDACTFELMRFQIRPDLTRDLPLVVKAVVSGEHAHIELRADVLIPGHRSKKSMQQNPCENIMICFPIPESWIPMFRIEKRFGFSSVKSTTKKAGKIKKGSLCPGLIEVSVGSAKYEHPYRSLVWRIPRLPEKNTDPNTTHIFMCRMDLSSDREIPSTCKKYAMVEYTMPNTTASNAAVRSISVANQRSPDRLVRYKAYYSYEVEIEQNFHFTAALENEDPRQCVQQ